MCLCVCGFFKDLLGKRGGEFVACIDLSPSCPDHQLCHFQSVRAAVICFPLPGVCVCVKCPFRSADSTKSLRLSQSQQGKHILPVRTRGGCACVLDTVGWGTTGPVLSCELLTTGRCGTRAQFPCMEEGGDLLCERPE